MLNLLGKALTGMVLDRDARDAMREAGGLASTIQGAADMRQVIQALQAAKPQIGGSTPLPPPPANTVNAAAMTNSAALQAALLAQILAEARATAAAAEKSAPPRAEPTLNVPRVAPTAAASPASPAPAPSTRPPASTPAGGLNAAIMAQALAAAQAAITNGQGQNAAPASAPAPRPSRGKRLPAADRAALIQNALKVHSAKQTILSSLSEEQRAKLTELATKLLDPTSGGSA